MRGAAHAKNWVRDVLVLSAVAVFAKTLTLLNVLNTLLCCMYPLFNLMIMS